MRVIYYKGGLICYRKYVVENEIMIDVKLIYFVSITQFIISKDKYTLTEKLTLKTLLNGYYQMIDKYNHITKNN